MNRKLNEDEIKKFYITQSEIDVLLKERNTGNESKAKVGMLGTKLMYSDRKPHVVVGIFKRSKIIITKEIKTIDMSDGPYNNGWVYDGNVKHLDGNHTLGNVWAWNEKIKEYVEIGKENKSKDYGSILTFDACYKYYDYSF